ncbi:autophagy protein 5 [Neocloeon triangulifer]|uniref:autophagy protein 5 n=1 Tax=Neocloeon triangulifer TaxID=2078957 RepID=UPI00286F8FD4|nr:autophagy protein 5 [Neocloeon triangulifer]
MASDREVLRQVWEGKLPVCFSLAEEELQVLQTPDAFYLMVPRLSYFPLVTEKVKRHFVRFVHPDKQDAEMWLDFNGTPLKWQYPIGVLFDSLLGVDATLPWNITVHFDKFPEKELLKCPSREVVECHYLSCIKEADALKHRTHIATAMQKKDHNQLWQGLQNDKFDQFWSINKKLMDCNQKEGFKHIPYRCHKGDQFCLPLQRLVRPIEESERFKTLGDLLSLLQPSDDKNSLRVITQGVEPSWDTPLQWLSEHFSYPDNFLHLSLHSI